MLATPAPVLVSQLRASDGGTLLKKVAGMAGTVETAQIDGGPTGIWIAGQQHVVYWLDAPPRLAGNVLLWEDGGVTYRIEGKLLTKERALELAREYARLTALLVYRSEAAERRCTSVTELAQTRDDFAIRLDRIGAGGG